MREFSNSGQKVWGKRRMELEVSVSVDNLAWCTKEGDIKLLKSYVKICVNRLLTGRVNRNRHWMTISR